MTIKASRLTMSPITEDKSAVLRALPGCPFLAMVFPSKMVAAAASVPGVPMRIAGDGTAIQTPLVGADQHGNGNHRIQIKRERDDHRYGHGGGQARNGSQYDASTHPGSNGQEDGRFKIDTTPAIRLDNI